MDRIQIEIAQPALDFPTVSSFKLLCVCSVRACCDGEREGQDD